MAKRRRSKGTWFPTLGILAGGEVNPISLTGIDGESSVLDNGQVYTRIHVLTFDAPDEGFEATSTLADIVGSEYLLRRVVGKFHAVYSGDATSPLYAKVSLGLFVARASGGNETDSQIPIGAPAANWAAGTSAENTEGAENYSPLAERTMREPWLFRRTWMLANSNHASTSTNPGSTTGTAKLAALAWEVFPPSTAGYGSVLDGPHIDAKTLRKVGQDDRLYMAVSTARWPLGGASGGGPQGNIVYHFDYRMFASLRKARQVGRF